ncbi:13318_t:CDS:2 [Ambispora leptoticha]|uniref:13318_t:CDS:1 n=1 Tax=Ambispora leptoticha TaxID=144679 RepID=A0A9N9AJV6_9GLOM|nr:13318_t:CDS:2 [Ambispora leptoticha]
MKINTTNNEKLPKIEITVSFPPDIMPINLIDRALEKTRRTGKVSRVPNAFIAYRTIFCKELQKTAHPTITQPQLSLITKERWSKEPENIRREYERIAAVARNLYTRICVEQKLFQESKNQDKEKEGSYSFWSKQHSEFALDPNFWQISPQTNEIKFSETNTPPSPECCDPCKKRTEILEKRRSDLEVRLNDLTEKMQKK